MTVRVGDTFIWGEDTAETMAVPCKITSVDEGGAWVGAICYTPFTEFWKWFPLPLPDFCHPIGPETGALP